MDGDLRQPRKLGLKVTPKPCRHQFDRGIFQPRQVVQVSVIEHLEEGIHGTTDPRMIVNPAGLGIDLPINRNLHFETVPVHLAAFVADGYFREGLGGLESEVLDQAGSHRASYTPRCRGSQMNLCICN